MYVCMHACICLCMYTCAAHVRLSLVCMPFCCLNTIYSHDHCYFLSTLCGDAPCEIHTRTCTYIHMYKLVCMHACRILSLRAVFWFLIRLLIEQNCVNRWPNGTGDICSVTGGLRCNLNKVVIILFHRLLQQDVLCTCIITSAVHTTQTLHWVFKEEIIMRRDGPVLRWL